MTFATDIERVAGAETILAAAISPKRSSYYDNPDHDLGNAPQPWAVVRPVLDYAYDTGYGWQDCHDVWVWTPTRVLFIHEYDGSTAVGSAPRDPSPFVFNTAAGDYSYGD